MTGEQLSDQERAQLRELKERDREVRAHEQAHVAAAGDLVVSGPSYETTRGPDGQQYATSGKVELDTAPEKDPQQTIEKAERIRRAALAPADPSPQDLKIAAEALQMAAQARMELNEDQREELKNATAPSAAYGENQYAKQGKEPLAAGQLFSAMV